MSVVAHIANLVVRQVGETAAAAAATNAAASPAEAPPACEADNEYDGRLGVRISAIFVILIGSMCGACFPVFASRHRGIGVPEWAFFIAKYFGSGVIIATAFIHLLAPANEALTDPCLTGIIVAYPWVEGIALMTLFVLFFVELMAMRYASFGTPPTAGGNGGGEGGTNERRMSFAPGDNHLSHQPHHHDVDEEDAAKGKEEGESAGSEEKGKTVGKRPKWYTPVTQPPAIDPNDHSIHDIDDYTAQLTAITILEFGVIFHSIFVGLTLAVSGTEFPTLYVVLVFHQTFEGLGLGSRLAATPWPSSNRRHSWTPYFFAIAYGLTTPIAIAVGLGVRETYAPGSRTALVVNGVFDSISAGILLYTGLVELMAHEFMFSVTMRRAPIGVVLAAVGIMSLGAGLMALLGKWA